MSYVLLNQHNLSDTIYRTNVPHLDLIPADRRLASSDVLLADAPGREKILKEKLERLQGRYDYIMIDNPPSLSLLSINSLVASENFIVTVSPAFLSLVGLQSLLETVEVIKKHMNLIVKLLGILPTIVDMRMKVTTEILDLLRDHFKEKVFKTVIRQNVKLLEAPYHGK